MILLLYFFVVFVSGHFSKFPFREQMMPRTLACVYVHVRIVCRYVCLIFVGVTKRDQDKVVAVCNPKNFFTVVAFALFPFRKYMMHRNSRMRADL